MGFDGRAADFAVALRCGRIAHRKIGRPRLPPAETTRVPCAMSSDVHVTADSAGGDDAVHGRVRRAHTDRPGEGFQRHLLPTGDSAGARSSHRKRQRCSAGLVNSSASRSKQNIRFQPHPTERRRGKVIFKTSPGSAP